VNWNACKRCHRDRTKCNVIGEFTLHVTEAVINEFNCIEQDLREIPGPIQIKLKKLVSGRIVYFWSNCYFQGKFALWSMMDCIYLGWKCDGTRATEFKFMQQSNWTGLWYKVTKICFFRVTGKPYSQCSLRYATAQLRSTTRHFQHSKFSTVYIYFA